MNLNQTEAPTNNQFILDIYKLTKSEKPLEQYELSDQYKNCKPLMVSTKRYNYVFYPKFYPPITSEDRYSISQNPNDYWFKLDGLLKIYYKQTNIITP